MEALFHRHLLQPLSMVSMSMQFRFTAWKKNSSGMGWLLPGRTWPTGWSAWPKIILGSCMTICTAYCMIIMWSRQMKRRSLSIKMADRQAVKAGCGSTAPVLWIRRSRSFCMNTRRPAMLHTRGNFWKIMPASVWQTAIRSTIPLKKRKKISGSQDAGYTADVSFMKRWKSCRKNWGNSLSCIWSWTRYRRFTGRKANWRDYRQKKDWHSVSWW